jgi:hypothetical protein
LQQSGTGDTIIIYVQRTGNKYGHYNRGGVWFEYYNGNKSSKYSDFSTLHSRNTNTKHHIAELKIKNPFTLDVSKLNGYENLYPLALTMILEGEKRITYNKVDNFREHLVNDPYIMEMYEKDEDIYSSFEYSNAMKLKKQNYDAVIFKVKKEIVEVFYVGSKANIKWRS